MNHHQHHDTSTPMFSFFELWRPDLLVLLILVGILYLLLIGPWRKFFADSERVPGKQVFYFFTSLGIIYLAKGTPINIYGHHIMFSAHMTQMALLYLVLPPIMIVGLPVWFYKSLLKTSFVKKTLHFLTLPLVSILLFNTLFSLYHFPFVFDNVMNSGWAHVIYHTALLISAFIMWIPVCSPLPEYETLTDLKKIVYIFAGGFLLTPVCALIIFARMPMYETYMGAPQIFHLLPSLDDQQLGGVIMKVIQELSYITAIAVIFFSWARKERRKDTEGVME